MQKAAPRLLIAGTNSGCGKTTVTCTILQALVDGGVSVAAAKCGPDYIDPMFHREIIGAKSSNLDPFFFDDDTLRFLLVQNGAGKDVTVIEGVMGYYDGIGLDSSRASTFEVAQRTESPVVLVLNAKGAGLSALAVLDGFLLQRARLRLSAANARLLAREPPPWPHHRGRGGRSERKDAASRRQGAGDDRFERAAANREECAAAYIHAAGHSGGGRACAHRRRARQGILLLL